MQTRIPVKTTAPRVPLVDWKNSRTGKTERIPQGIDPGWDTNPGKSRQAKAEELLTQKQATILPTITAPLKPASTTIIRSIEVPENKAGRLIKPAITALDKTLNLPKMPKVPITSKNLDGRRGGNYVFDIITGRPLAIEIDPKGPFPVITSLHEIGHLVAHQAFSPGQFANPIQNPELVPWFKAVTESNNYQYWQSSNHPLRSHVFPKDEQWARSFAQFVVTQTQDPALFAQLDKTGTVHKLYYWEKEDFFAIHQAMLKIFQEKGWLK